MAVSLFALEVSELCLGKPALVSLSVKASVEEALVALKSTEDDFISVWNCDHRLESNNRNLNPGISSKDSAGYDSYDEECVCVGRISMVDVICYICRDERNLMSPSEALKKPVSLLLPESPGVVLHVKPSCRLSEAIDLMLQGAQNLIVPIGARTGRRKRTQNNKASNNFSVSSSPSSTIHQNGVEFCWLTQEDVLRFLLGSISLFSPIAGLSLTDLGICGGSRPIFAVDYNSAASSTLSELSRASLEQTAVAVVESDDDKTILIDEISRQALSCCDETAAAALATLSVEDFVAYINGGAVQEWLASRVKARLRELGFWEMAKRLEIMSPCHSPSGSSSSDDESTAKAYRRSRSLTSRRSEAEVCSPRSSLVAVMIQAIAHRVNHVWVIDEDSRLLGSVTLLEILKVFRDHGRIGLS